MFISGQYHNNGNDYHFHIKGQIQACWGVKLGPRLQRSLPFADSQPDGEFNGRRSFRNNS
jgi:hypothetical protein